MRTLYLQNWLAEYCKWRLLDALRPEVTSTTHVLFLFVDHFELAGKPPRLAEWLTRYPQLAARHSDADGLPPRHTWFYAMDLMREEELEKLTRLVGGGFGEVELHWHHENDTPHSFRERLQAGLNIFHKYGFMLPRRPGKPASFGFIHGNWSLNNVRGKEYCGVDNEIQLLKQAGCYADFTFPALHTSAQPATVNAIYYAGFDPGIAGYSKGRTAELGKREKDDEFMIFTGPLLINFTDWRYKWHPLIENGEIGKTLTHGDPKRVDAWVKAGIHVKGRPEWVFVKVFCHGGQDHQQVLGAETDRMFSYLEARYNDGVRYKLHYVTAREAYNIVKAAEQGLSGDPGRYRDFGEEGAFVDLRCDLHDFRQPAL